MTELIRMGKAAKTAARALAAAGPEKMQRFLRLRRA